MIVSGGTPRKGRTRMKELANQLECVPDYFTLSKQFRESLQSGIPAIKSNLESWHKLNYHLVGSREYVYRSEKLLEIITHLEEVVNAGKPLSVFELINFHGGQKLPRTFDLRKTVIRHLLKIGV